jgi:hypothetical protein
MADTRIKAGQFFGVIGHGTDGYFLMTNADGSMSWAEGGASGPSVTSVSYPGDDLAADPAGDQTVVLTGTGFAASGMTVSIGGTTAPSVAHDSNTQLTITTPQKAAGDYDIVVTNTVTGASGTFVNGISYNGVPTWTTATGSLGTFESETTISTITLQATEPDGGTITFNITNGALPTGLSLTGANIDGTTTAESSTTLYSFTIEAIDDENQSTPRNFSITVNAFEITPSENFTINTYTGNGSTQSIEGKIGTAASFNGSSSKIETTLDRSSFTSLSYSCWIKTSSTAQQRIIDSTESSTQSHKMGLYTRFDGTRGIRYVSIGDDLYDTGNLNNLLGEWFHLAVTDGGGDNVTVYINGQTVSITKVVNNGNYETPDLTTIGTGKKSSNVTGDYFNGKIDQVRIFNRALDETTNGEVTTLYGEPSNTSTASTTDIFGDGSGIALYEFEEGAKDTGGVNGYIGAAGVFDGSSSYIDLPLTTSNSTTSNQMSISFFMNLNTSGTDVEFIVESTNADNYMIHTGGGAGSQGLRIGLSAGNYLDISNAYTSNTWQHFVVVWGSGFVKVYRDGTEIGSKTSSYTPSSFANLFIGARGGGSYFLNGKLDQVRIFNKAISSSEVTTLYGETSASATKSTTDIFDDGSGVALYELEGNANDTGNTYNGTATNVSYGYDGTPTNVSFVGTSFQPDLVWVKSRNHGYSHHIQDVIRGAGPQKDISSDGTWAEGTFNYGSVDSFDANGFTVGSGGHPTYGRAQTNESGKTYVAWCWKAGGSVTPNNNTEGSIASTVSANPDAGFSIVKYTGNGNSSASFGHGLSQAPDIYIIKRTDSTGTWVAFTTTLLGGTPQNFISLNSTAAAGVASQPLPDSSVINVQPVFDNINNATYIAYCFHSVDGYQKVGYYTSNASVKITTGFEPRWIMIKYTGVASNWWIMDASRYDGSTGTNGGKLVKPYLEANTSDAEGSPAGGSVEFVSDGFYPTNFFNSNGVIYLAIA